ncbi:hypothetical protein M407DRAFT_19853 [Tulasnella calospora MUT 4182]|uniref:Uncharacterized protein n=1 Tax=Tulasnella calospora MUT 4182 TaxID=1051891 RepID=A0A0C3MBW1_9AGAM|nr:hypothetical protein M407DRAFT_19853 [Tulasnella calospora MUT 4182]
MASEEPQVNNTTTGQEPAFVPRPAIYNASMVAMQSAGVGVLVSAVQNALAQHNAGAMGIFTRTGGTIGFFAALGGTFALADSVSANIREKDDAVNGFVGGCSAGALAGLRARSIPTAVMACGVMGGLVATFDATGRSFTGSEDAEDREARRRRFFKKPPPFLEKAFEKPEGEVAP